MGLHTVAQLVEHCSANAEATGPNPVEALKKFFRLFRNCLICDSTVMVTYSFHFYSHSSHHFILCFILSRVDELSKLASLHIWVFIAQLVEQCSTNVKAMGLNPVEAPKNFFSGYFAIA